MIVCVFGGGEGGRHCLSTVYVQAKVIFFLFLKCFFLSGSTYDASHKVFTQLLIQHDYIGVSEQNVRFGDGECAIEACIQRHVTFRACHLFFIAWICVLNMS